VGHAIQNAAPSGRADERLAMEQATDTHRLLELQRAAQRRDGIPTAAIREDRLKQLAALVLANREAFATAISEDFGGRSSFETALLETMVTLTSIRHARANLRRWMRPQRQAVAYTFWPGSAWIRRDPLGVVGIVSPWNYPLQLALSPLVDVLAAGNRAILKPSEQTPVFSELLKTRIAVAFSEDEVAVVTGGPDVAAAFTKLAFDHLLFTGSTAIGRKVALAAAEGLVPTTLELGGKSPAVLCPSASLAKAAQAISYGKFINAGQTCIAPDYVLAPRGRVDAIAAAIMDEVVRAYPDLGEDYSSLISERSFARLTEAVAQAERMGAHILRHPTASDPARRRLTPTIVVNAPADCDLMQDEIFGPVLPVVGYDTLDGATDLIADQPHPLALYVFGESGGEVARVLDRTQSGGVTVNGTLMHIAQDNLPFGGVGASGLGAYHGRAGFERFTHARGVFKTGFFNSASLLAPPYGARAKQLLKFLMR
jgi:coniferyl-aldehyde dehydrogenase